MKIYLTEMEYAILQLVLRDDKTNAVLNTLADVLKGKWEDEKFMESERRKGVTV